MKKIFVLSLICFFYCVNAMAQAYGNNDDWKIKRREEEEEEIFYDQTGNYYRKIGNSYYGNNGQVYTKTGNIISGSDGSLFETSGDSIYMNGEEKCRRRGFYLECN